MLVIAFGGLLALIAMHGITGHGLHIGHDDLAAAEPEMAVDVHAVAGHDHDAGHHDDGSKPCPSCAHGTDELCALIVMSAVLVPNRSTGVLELFTASAPRPPMRTLTPDPPVPKRSLVLNSI